MTHRDLRRKSPIPGQDIGLPTNPVVFAGFWLLIFLGTVFVGGPWAGFHGIMIGGAGLLMALAPPAFSLPRSWWYLAGIFMVTACACFLPIAWFGMPVWRMELEKLGLDTGTQVVIQSRQAAETLALFAVMLVTGLWMAGHRASAAQVRFWALAFTVGVAVYAILARIMQDTSISGEEGRFGFFPNRNHTATYLAMGTVCGLGCVMQAIRDKRFFAVALAIVATTVCLWAAASWSISRAGIVLIAVGSIAWLSMLGRSYLGRHGLWAVGLFALTVVGMFFIVDSTVKQRLTATVEKAGVIIGAEGMASPDGAKPAINSAMELDFRIPTMLDTLGMIGKHPWTGHGPGQYFYVFPQYRHLTMVAQDADSYHPESDWLWMAAETGIIPTLALLALLILAFRKSLAGILRGRDRALRGACLIAAMIVPLHGVFDVPVHRITLAWSAAFLFALSLHAPSSEFSVKKAVVWPFRALSLLWIAAAALLIHAQWWGGPEPAVTRAKSALTEARRLYAEDVVLRQVAAEKGKPYQPDPAEDKLEQALVILENARSVAPIDRDILRYQAFLALHFDDRYARIDRLFALDRTLDPTWVEGPFRQAEAWSSIDLRKTLALWEESVRRARKVERLQPENRWNRENTRERIRQFALGKPELEKLVPRLD